MKFESDNLINQLVADLKPVKVVKFNLSYYFKFFAVGFFCLTAAVLVLGVRSDFEELVVTKKFIIETILLVLLSLLSIMAAFSLSVPSMNFQKIYRIPLAVFGFIILLTGISFMTAEDPFMYWGHGTKCVYEIISISVLPASLLFYFIRRAAVLKRDIVGLLVLLSGVSFGLLGVQLTCVDSTPMHLIFWHLLPAALIMVFGIWLSRKLIKKI